MHEEVSLRRRQPERNRTGSSFGRTRRPVGRERGTSTDRCSDGFTRLSKEVRNRQPFAVEPFGSPFSTGQERRVASDRFFEPVRTNCPIRARRFDVPHGRVRTLDMRGERCARVRPDRFPTMNDLLYATV
ncbi:MAG TPA: hypothetical protein DCQ98_19820 [Planctomycetaceae bacterium]|nr:hypothetical protein [Planctomycetaceae bacterium]